tara:strand:+ start:2337 stop:3320 length:984 start_codon:yes stop_codon:yes gene_type:complete
MDYKAYLVEENEGSFSGSIQNIPKPPLDLGKVIIKVNYSSLNYKDALAATGVRGIAKSYPFVPGIDLAGEILESSSSEFDIGDKVLATGYKIGMSEFGGFGEIVHLPLEWILKMPTNLTFEKAMSYGTAGITAAACVKKIVDASIEKKLPILVSGSTGGVGSVAVGVLSLLGYEVHAITSKVDEEKFLLKMGASKVLLKKDFMKEPTKPLDKGLYGGAVDVVGGDMLAKIISMISNHGVVSCCGNVGGAMFSSSVFPFILRGVQLSGIDSAESSLSLKKELWNLLANDWSINLQNQTRVIKIDAIDDEITRILNGDQIGRVVIKHGG